MIFEYEIWAREKEGREEEHKHQQLTRMVSMALRGILREKEPSLVDSNLTTAKQKERNKCHHQLGKNTNKHTSNGIRWHGCACLSKQRRNRASQLDFFQIISTSWCSLAAFPIRTYNTHTHTHTHTHTQGKIKKGQWQQDTNKKRSIYVGEWMNSLLTHILDEFFPGGRVEQWGQLEIPRINGVIIALELDVRRVAVFVYIHDICFSPSCRVTDGMIWSHKEQKKSQLGSLNAER